VDKVPRLHRVKVNALLVMALWGGSGFAAACIELVGEVRQGGLLWGQVQHPWQQAYLDDEPLRISPEGIVVFGFGRDVTGSVDLRLYDGSNDWCTQPLLVQTREYKISRVEGVPQRTVTPDPSDAQRIAAEREKVRQAKAITTDRTDFTSGFQWPVTGRVSGVYGSQRIYNGKPGSPHYGVDVAQPTGTPVAAPAPGVIVLAEPDLFYSGGTIIIDHGSQVSSSMLQLSEVSGWSQAIS
jgi:hypothetical protein